jgi:hypothetical protein
VSTEPIYRHKRHKTRQKWKKIVIQINYKEFCSNSKK